MNKHQIPYSNTFVSMKFSTLFLFDWEWRRIYPEKKNWTIFIKKKNVYAFQHLKYSNGSVFNNTIPIDVYLYQSIFCNIINIWTAKVFEHIFNWEKKKNHNNMFKIKSLGNELKFHFLPSKCYTNRRIEKKKSLAISKHANRLMVFSCNFNHHARLINRIFI